MKKILTALLLVASSQVSAVELCHSSGKAYAKALNFIGSGFTGGYVITNISNIPINVKAQMRDPNGIISGVSADQYKFNFSSSNTPLNSNGATLQPGEQGDFYFSNNRDVGVTEISWSASAEGCIEKAVFASTVKFYSTSSRYGRTDNPINGGKPF